MSPEFWSWEFGPPDQIFSRLWSDEPLFQEFCSPGHTLSQIKISMTGNLFTQPTPEFHTEGGGTLGFPPQKKLMEILSV